MLSDGWELGIRDEIKARREYVEGLQRRSRGAYKPPKVHRITVNCRTGERTFQTEEIIVKPPRVAQPKPRPVKHTPNPAPLDNARPFALTIAEARSVERIVETACRIWGVERYRFDDRTRVQAVSRARFAVGLFIRRHLQWSYTRMGRRFNIDHTSALHWIKRGTGLLERDAAWRDRYHALEAELLASQSAGGA